MVENIVIDNKLSKAIQEYCALNSIEDISSFANKCTLKGFNIVKYGTSPLDNIKREELGIKDVSMEEDEQQNDLVEEQTKETKKPKIESRKIKIVKK